MFKSSRSLLQNNPVSVLSRQLSYNTRRIQLSQFKNPIVYSRPCLVNNSNASLQKPVSYSTASNAVAKDTKDIHEHISKEYENPIDDPANHDYFFTEDGKRRVTIHDEEFPDPLAEKRLHRRAFIAFVVLMLTTVAGIVKYEDANSPVVTSTLYTLRRSEKARALLGDNISFVSLFPWISGVISTIHGNVEFSYHVKGSKVKNAVVKFKAVKSPSTGKFTVEEWSVTPEGQETVSLLDEEYMPFIPKKNEEATSKRKSEL